MLSDYLQTFIHCMNRDRIRSAVIRQHMQTCGDRDSEWLGTWYVRNTQPRQLHIAEPSTFFPRNHLHNNFQTSLYERQDRLIKGKRYKTFTVCILYDLNRVHYVAFVYDSVDRSLTSFDPGAELYLHGMRTIIPIVRNAFRKLQLISHKSPILGPCTDYLLQGKKAGVQYNGRVDTHLPADAFCQTWTLFFVCNLLSLHSTAFVRRWCRIPPKRREAFLIVSFIIPTLQQNPTVSTKYFSMVQDKRQTIMEELSSYTTNTLFE